MAAMLWALLLAAAPVEPEWHLKVHLLSEADRLELRRIGDDSLVCRTPCDTLLTFRAGDEFVLKGGGIVPSGPFYFHPRDGEVTLRAHPKSIVWWIVGGAALATGGYLAIDGGLRLLGEATFGTVFCDQDPACINQHARDTRDARIKALVGVGTLAAGALVIGLNLRTTFEIVPR